MSCFEDGKALASRFSLRLKLILTFEGLEKLLMGLARYRSVLSKVVTFSLSKSPRTGLGLALALSMAADRLIRREIGALLLRLANALCLKAVFSSLDNNKQVTHQPGVV